MGATTTTPDHLTRAKQQWERQFEGVEDGFLALLSLLRTAQNAASTSSGLDDKDAEALEYTLCICHSLAELLEAKTI